MTAFVLVHGAWGGSWGFRKVRPLLQQAGHETFTPSLTGIGEREHLTSEQVTLSTHVEDVVRHVICEDLDHIVLLGFSYGGMVVTGALDRIGERVDHLVYLDAFVPDDGQSVVDLVGGASFPTDGWRCPDRGSWPPRPRPHGQPSAGPCSRSGRSPSRCR